MTAYELDVQVHAAAAPGRYRVDCRASTGGACTVDTPLALDASLTLQLEYALLSSSADLLRRRTAGEDERVVRDVGDRMFRALFTGEALSLYDSARHAARLAGRELRLVLRTGPPEIAALPWEYLFDRRHDRFLALVSPLVRHPGTTESVRPLRVEPPLRILAMTAHATLLDVDAERRHLSGSLAGLVAAGRARLDDVPGPTWRDLDATLLAAPWHILHLIGHGGFDTAAGEGILHLGTPDGQRHEIAAQDFALLVNRCPSLRLVVLNSCESARGAADDAYSSAAVSLIRVGVPAVLAMQHEISDRAAIEFTRSFYASLAAGRAVDEAALDARIAVRVAIPGSLEWGTPVLFLRQRDGLLFDIRPAGRAPVRDAAPPREGLGADPRDSGARPGSPARPVAPARPARWAPRRAPRRAPRLLLAVAAVFLTVVAGAVALRLRPGGHVGEFDVPADVEWTDTGIVLRRGQAYRITASGTVNTEPGISGGPDGLERAGTLPRTDGAHGALIGRIGDGPGYPVGALLTGTAPADGPLALGVNDLALADNTGAFRVEVSY